MLIWIPRVAVRVAQAGVCRDGIVRVTSGRGAVCPLPARQHPLAWFHPRARPTQKVFDTAYDKDTQEARRLPAEGLGGHV